MNRNLIESYKQQITEARVPNFFRNLGRGVGKTARVGKGAVNWAADNPYKTLGLGIAGTAAGIGAAKYFGSGSSPSSVENAKEEKRARKLETKEMQSRLRQEMSNIRSSGDTDEVSIRKKAIENLGKDENFVAQANALGYSVGKVGGSESAMFGYRHSTGAEARQASEASRSQLFDTQGRAKVFEKDPTTGKLVGRDPTDAEVAARKQPVAPVQTDSGESRATYYGRLAQRGVNIFKEPRSLDQENYRRAAERDIEREGRLDRYKNRGEVMRGMEERGFTVGEGDFQALYKEKKAQRSQADADLLAKTGDREPTEDEIEQLRKRYEEIEKNTTGKYYR
jgi:hypothetical protein